MKNVYFLSDAHLGSRAIEHSRTQERRLVNFLDSIKHKAAAVYLLGDMFDFGTSSSSWCRRVTPVSSARFPNSPTWAWKCISSLATTTFGVATTWKRNVESSSTASR